MSPARYAIYFAPKAGTPLAEFGARWLNPRDRGEALLDLALQRRITATARRYGFHATLKAPFRLAEDRTPAELQEALAHFAANQSVPAAPPLALRQLSGFLALVPSAAAPELAVLAQACVEAFEPFRAPPAEAELARRRAAGLTPRQDANLLSWGYPYVAEDFRFHMTLTQRLAGEELSRVESALAPAVAPLCQDPLGIDALALFRQDGPEESFELVKRTPLAVQFV